MKRGLILSFMAAMLLLGGCASPMIRSDVTTFHEWPASLPDKSFVFERNRAQDNNLEYQTYENLVRAELLRLGFTQAAVNTSPALKVTLAYQVTDRDLKVVQPVVVHPGGWGPGWGPYWGPSYYGPRWPGYRYYDPFFYDPFWHAPAVVSYQESSYRLYKRQLQVTITRAADAKKLFDVTVVSEGQNPSLAAAMPYMVKSAFSDFPGRSGVPRRVELEFKEPAPVPGQSPGTSQAPVPAPATRPAQENR